MGSRLELQTMLEELLGSRNVYYQPPASIKMQYPAIEYHRDSMHTTHADDVVYSQTCVYKVTVIDEDPDSEIIDKLMALPYARFDRHFTSDNLNHEVFTLYF